MVEFTAQRYFNDPPHIGDFKGGHEIKVLL